MIETTELIPTNGRGSFWGKAHVIHQRNGDKTLKSYSTIVGTIKRNGECIRHWNPSSRSLVTVTTCSHIKSMELACNKSEFLNLPYIDYIDYLGEI